MRKIKEIFIGTLSTLLYFINLVLIMIPFFFVALVKFLIPIKKVRVVTDYILNMISTYWISVNGIISSTLTNTKWEVNDFGTLKMKEWYLVISNHQSWVDILVLQKIFNKKIPFIKFFIKKQLLFVPILGFAWWALDFPTMRRYKREEIEKNPKLKGKDLEETKKACERFKNIPVSIMNFVEGTRFTKEKHKKQNSPFKHLLKPKAGGIAFVLSAMGGNLNKILDVTISYPTKKVTFWDYMAGKVDKIKVNVKLRDITHDLIGDYFNDSEFKKSFQSWLNDIWEEKDKLLEEMA